MNEPMAPGRATPSIAFDRAMAGVDTRCSQLTTLLDLGDLDRVEYVARSAVNVWLAGSAAYRRLVQHHGPTIAEVKATRQRLDVMYLQQLDVMKRAYALLEGHPSHNTLDDLRMQLVTAAAQLDIDAAPEGRAPSAND
jgi:hypothetical protein